MARPALPGRVVPPSVFRFGDCRIDLSSRELRRGGELLVLSPKVFDCLAYLIERRERAVGRDELVAAVWGKTEITDTLLGQTILKARRAVGDSADAQSAIRTIPRFGYAWVAGTTAESADRAPAPCAASPRIRSYATALLVALATVGALALAYRALRRLPEPAPPRAAAVLPVEVTAPAEWAWVRLGLMDAIASRLREGEQPVVPSDNVVALARAERTADVRRATGAALLVAPSAVWSEAGWNVRLEWQGDGATGRVEARNADVLLAGKEAADRLLARLGRTPPADALDPQAWTDAKLLRQADAALLTDDLDGAKRLLASAPDSLKSSPEYALRLAKIDFRAGRFDAAGERLRDLLAEAPAESEAVLRARVLNGLGHVAMRSGRVRDAQNAYAEAASLLDNRDDPGELGHAEMGLGIAAQSEARYDDAHARFAQARVAFELAGDALALARVEANEGMLDAARDRYAAAAPALVHAAERFATFGTNNELAMTTSAAIGAHLALLQPHEALAAAERAWPLRNHIGNPGARQALAINSALALDANGRRREAETLLEATAAEADAAGNAIVAATARAELARIAMASGRTQQANALALAAVPELERADDVRDRLPASLVATRALRAAGDTERAGAEVARLGAWAGERTYAVLAEAEQQAAERRDARPSYERALALARASDVPADIAEVAISYGLFLIAAGDLDGATAVAGEAARWSDRDFRCALLQLRLYAALDRKPAWERALASARALAGDREIPSDLSTPR